MNRIKQVVHLAAHFGGGVGKALSGLALQATKVEKGIEHVFVSIEKPNKTQFVDKIKDSGCRVIVCPSSKELRTLIAEADILQLEWWNHPATLKCLSELNDIPVRLLSWSHVSGLHTPIIPQQLIMESHKFLFTSACSYKGAITDKVLRRKKNDVNVVSSSGGFGDFPYQGKSLHEKFSVGYVGSFHFAKLHPHYVEYLAAVQIPDFRVRMIGDPVNCDTLNLQAKAAHREGMFEFRGYCHNITDELSKINILAYLLNPKHYGTTENALIEAMAMGIVPVVLGNPAEQHIVDDKITGLIVHSPADFAAAIKWLYENPHECAEIGLRASKKVQERFSAVKMESLLTKNYRDIMQIEKCKIDFQDICGHDPAQWFLSCQERKDLFASDGSIKSTPNHPAEFGMFEKKKGSVFHFSEFYPDNDLLQKWAKNLNACHPRLQLSAEHSG